MLKYWTDPKDWTEWTQKFQEVQSELDAIEIVDPIHLEPGEIIEPDPINVEYSKVDEAFQHLGEIKDKFNRLKTIAKRWYDQKKSDMVIKAALLPDSFNAIIYLSITYLCLISF